MLRNILTTVHAMTKLFVPLSSAQDGESADIELFSILKTSQNGKILMKHQVYNKGISSSLDSFS